MGFPQIGIPVPTSFDSAYNEQCWPEYARAVQESGGEPVQIPVTVQPRQIQEDYADLHGVLLPGSGADVDPSRYGQAREPESAAADLPREETDRALLEFVERSGRPLLAICYGLQSLNVWRGGTLIQHLQPLPVNHRAGRPVAAAHPVHMAADSRLSALTSAGKGETAMVVNSSHHQAAGALGAGLRRTAWCPVDGVLEAVEDPDHPWLVGLQWHPERTLDLAAPDGSNPSRAIFHGFVAAAAARVR